MLSALLGALSFFSKIFGWLDYRRTKNIGKLEGEVERLREESDRMSARKKKDVEINTLDRAAVVDRLRRFTRKDGS